MNDPVLFAIAAGLSLGAVVGYRITRALVLRVGGPFARKPLVIACAACGGLLVVVPAVIISVLIGIKLGGGGGGPEGTSVSIGAFAALAAAMALAVAGSLVVGAFAGTLCARLIEQASANH
jgi:hypothetical protein